jgi:hypothetical protein
LMMGGDVGKTTLLFVHTFAGIKGAVPVVKGVYMGGLDEVKRLAVEGAVEGAALRDQGRLFLR